MRILLLILLMGAAILAPDTAQADDWRDPIVVAQNNCKSLQQAVAEIRRKTGGQIVSANTRVRNGREVHHIKVLSPDGTVKTHKVQGCRRNNGR